MKFANADRSTTIAYYRNEHNALTITEEQFGELVDNAITLHASLITDPRKFSPGDSLYAPLFDRGDQSAVEDITFTVTDTFEHTNGHTYVTDGEYAYSLTVYSKRCLDALVALQVTRKFTMGV
jgi:hypothetical protein